MSSGSVDLGANTGGGGGGSGTVTSVGLSDSTNTFNVTGTPVTTSGSLTIASYKSQAANTVLAAPNGSSGAPTFRVLSPTDLPNFNPTSSATTFQFFDDFHNYSVDSDGGPLSLFYSVSGAAGFSRVAPINSNQIGIFGFNAGNTADGAATAACNVSDVLLGGASITYNVYGQMNFVPTVGDNWLTKLGLINTFPGAQNGVFFTFDRGISTTNWIAVTTAASTPTNTDTGVAADTGWHSFRIEINAAGTSVDFYIDGVKVATNTTNIPTTAGQEIGPMISIQCVSSSSAGQMDIDYLLYKYKLGTNRGTY